VVQNAREHRQTYGEASRVRLPDQRDIFQVDHDFNPGDLRSISNRIDRMEVDDPIDDFPTFPCPSKHHQEQCRAISGKRRAQLELTTVDVPGKLPQESHLGSNPSGLAFPGNKPSTSHGLLYRTSRRCPMKGTVRRGSPHMLLIRWSRLQFP
jgi:hypothetical protein